MNEPFYRQQETPRQPVTTPQLSSNDLQKLGVEEIPYTQGNIQQLKDWHKVFAEMQLMGKKNVDIARELQVHQMTLSKVQRSPVYKIYIRDLRKQAQEDSIFDVSKHLQQVTQKTFETMYDLMVNAESETVRASMVKEHADRILPKVTKIESDTKSTIFFESETIQMLAQNLKESCNLTDVDFSDKSDEEVIDLLEENINRKDGEDGNNQ